MLQSILLFFVSSPNLKERSFTKYSPSSYIGSTNILYYGTEGVAFYVNNLKNTFVLYLQKQFGLQSLNYVPWNELAK